jgi:hypothetical protein
MLPPCTRQRINAKNNKPAIILPVTVWADAHKAPGRLQQLTKLGDAHALRQTKPRLQLSAGFKGLMLFEVLRRIEAAMDGCRSFHNGIGLNHVNDFDGQSTGLGRMAKSSTPPGLQVNDFARAIAQHLVTALVSRIPQ